MAGGTGGHIFPGLAVAAGAARAGLASALAGRAWQHGVSAWCRPQGFPLETIDFSGVRGKGLVTLALLPLRLLKAFAQAWAVVRRVRPDVVVGLGGYISFPGGMMAALAGKPLVLHEQNSVAGMANKVLADVAEPRVLRLPRRLEPGRSGWVTPARRPFCGSRHPAERFAGRTGPLAPAGGGRQPGRQVR